MGGGPIRSESGAFGALGAGAGAVGWAEGSAPPSVAAMPMDRIHPNSTPQGRLQLIVSPSPVCLKWFKNLTLGCSAEAAETVGTLSYKESPKVITRAGAFQHKFITRPNFR
jgi:hypothetical protein